MLGKTIYYLDFKENSVKSAVVIDEHISTSGYASYMILDGSNVSQKEAILCFKTEDEAIASLKRLKPVVDKINDIVNETNKKVDELRIELLGEPTLVEYKDIR